MIADAYGPVTFEPGTFVGEHCVLGFPKETRLRRMRDQTAQVECGEPVMIGKNCLIFNHAVIYEGVRIGEGTVIEDRVRIGYNSTVGPHARIAYGAYICDRVTAGTRNRVAGFVCDETTIGDRSTVTGDLVHEYTHPHEDWWAVDEQAPVIAADTAVGWWASLMTPHTV